MLLNFSSNILVSKNSSNELCMKLKTGFFLFFRACAVDISKFCRDIPHGSGQQLKCLSNVIRDAKLRLEPKCDAMLRTRLEMFDMALKVVPINGIQDLWIHVSNNLPNFFNPKNTSILPLFSRI